MKTKMKMIVLSITMFVAGIAAACMIGRVFVWPDLAKDIGKLAFEGADTAYKAGYIDGTNQNNDMYNYYMDDEEVREMLKNWEYKYIK